MSLSQGTQRGFGHLPKAPRQGWSLVTWWYYGQNLLYWPAAITKGRGWTALHLPGFMLTPKQILETGCQSTFTGHLTYAKHCTMPLFTPIHSICAKRPAQNGCPDHPDWQTWTLGNWLLAQGLPAQSTQPGLSPCDVYLTATISVASVYKAGLSKKQLKLWARAQK